MLIREAALRLGLTYEGVTEHPPNSNRGAFVDGCNTDAGVPLGSPYCCSFQHSMFRRAANYALGGGGSVARLLTWAREQGYVVKRPRRGDLVCFDFNEGHPYGPYGDHVGQIVRVLAVRWSGGTFTGLIKTCEANTSAQGDPGGSQSNGGGVFIRTRWIRGIGAQFVRVPGNVK